MRFRLIPKPTSPSKAASVTIRPAAVVVRQRPLRVLDFDIENRPLTYLGSDFTTAEVTAISWAWTDRPHDVTVHLLGESELPDILNAFIAVYQQADMVTGHYIKGHDLPMINGALVECRMPTLPDKLVQDTKLDLVRTKGLSMSQESLSAMFRLEHDKVHMNQHKWRAANRLTPEGIAEARHRVTGDVKQHIEMRAELLELGYLGPPSIWRGGTARAEAYTP